MDHCELMNLTCGTKLYTDYIDPIGNTINIGDYVGGKFIYILTISRF
jgi:hypothetical protein